MTYKDLRLGALLSQLALNFYKVNRLQIKGKTVLREPQGVEISKLDTSATSADVKATVNRLIEVLAYNGLISSPEPDDNTVVPQ